MNPTNFIPVENLTAAQFQQLLEMYRTESWSLKRTPEDVRVMLENCRIIALIQPTNGDVIAFARFLSDSVYRAMIYDVIVAKKYRGLGYGRVLVEQLVRHPLLNRVERVELYCRDHNVPFYEKLGFAKVCGETNFMRRTV